MFDHFLEWKILVENQTGKRIKCLRTDNGLEFLNEKFASLCKSAGISRHLTTARTPQHNGLAERFNRTILEKVRCLLSNAQMPRTFWGEAVNTATYIINRSPSTTLDFKTPHEVWTGQAPNLKHMKVFGCAAYAHVRQDKLLPRAKKCLFLVCPEGVKAYKLWCLELGEHKVHSQQRCDLQRARYALENCSN